MARRSLLRRVVRKVRDGVHALRDDARYPGRDPVDHVVTPQGKPPPTTGAEVAAQPPPHPASDSPPPAEAGATNLRSGEDVAWYLAGADDVDGWDEVDGGS